MPTAKMTKKVGTQLLVSPETRARGWALAIVRQESMAEIWRTLIEQAMPGMERAHADQLARLSLALDRMGVDRAEGIEAMVTDGIGYHDLFQKDGVTPRLTFPTAR